MQGKEISALLHIQPSEQFKSILNSVMEWQLEHPEGTKDECKEYIKNKVVVTR